MNYLIWINTSYACGSIVCNEQGIVIQSCPIYYKRCINRHFRQFERWLNSKHLLVQWVLADKYTGGAK